MSMNSDQMRDWVIKNSKFVKVEEGEPFIGTVEDAKAITKDSPSGESIEVIRFTLRTADGTAKTWDTRNGGIIDKMAGYMNRKVCLSCTGEGSKKRYNVEMEA